MEKFYFNYEGKKKNVVARNHRDSSWVAMRF